MAGDRGRAIFASLSFPRRPATDRDHARGSPSLARSHGLHFYDALIVAAAIEAGCDTLSSEDLQHSRSFGGLMIVNPFLLGS